MSWMIRAESLPSHAEAVMRMLLLDIADYGISAREIEWWREAACWFPHRRDSVEVENLRDCLPDELRSGVCCEPQILWHLPERYEGELWPHVDQEPPWAEGRKYIRIVGVALTPQTRSNGAIRLHTDKGIVVPEMKVGEILVMDPKLPHTRGINYSGQLRAMVYFRFLEGMR